MNKVKILLKQHSYLYGNNEYDFFDVSNMVKINNSKIKIIILEEPIFVKIFQVDRNITKIEDFIEEKIENIFPQNGDILYDYEIVRREGLLSIYSIKGKKKVEKLIATARDARVIPIQFFIREVISKRMRNKKLTCGVIIKIDKNYYFVYIKRGLIAYNYISPNIDEIIDKIELQAIKDEIYIDESIDYTKAKENNTKYIKINIKDKIYEKLH